MKKAKARDWVELALEGLWDPRALSRNQLALYLVRRSLRFGRRVARRAWRVLKVVAVVMGVLGAIAFAEWWVEEGLQQVSFACYQWSRLGEGLALAQCAESLLSGARFLQGFNNTVGWLNPLFYHVVQFYAQSALQQAQVWGRVAAKLLAGCRWEQGRYVCPQVPKLPRE